MSGQEQDSQAPVAANLLAEIKRTGITTTELARALEVHERQVTRWRGGTVPRYATVARIAQYFGRDVAWFYTDHDDEPVAA